MLRSRTGFLLVALCLPLVGRAENTTLQGEEQNRQPPAEFVFPADAGGAILKKMLPPKVTLTAIAD